MNRSATPFKSVVDLMAKLGSDSDSRSYLKALLWGGEKPSGCPRCGDTTTYAFKDGRTHKCAGCKQKFNVLTGTIFENTKLPLNKWIACIWMAASFKRGISSYQVARNIGVTQKTAWFMMQRVRVLFDTLKIKEQELSGTCAADEAYVGGLERFKHYNKRLKNQRGRGASGKINVFGVMQVGGKVFTTVVPNVKTETLCPLIKRYVKNGSTMMTDEWQSYNGLRGDYNHMVTDHGKYQYVSKEGATTNSIENYWSHIKRAIRGAYYKMTRKHIERYLSEFDFKFNYRDLRDNDKFVLLLSNSHNTRLSYKQLIQ